VACPDENESDDAGKSSLREFFARVVYFYLLSTKKDMPKLPNYNCAWRLRFSLRVDIVRLINSHIIIIIIIITTPQR